MNLVETAAIVKKMLVGIAVLLFLYITLLVLKSPIKDTWYTFFPQKDLPNLAYGLLDPLDFTEVRVSATSPKYKLFTRDGNLPNDFPEKLPVYKFMLDHPSLFEGENAQKDALTLGFSDTMRISDLSAKKFIWQDVIFGGNLEINTSTRSLELTTPLNNVGSFFPAGKLTQTQAIKDATNLLISMGRLNDKLYLSDIRGSQKVAFGKFSVNGVVEANSILEAQIARVDFFRKIFDYPILGTNPEEGLLNVTLRVRGIKDGNPQLNYPKVKAYHSEINTDNTATYPLIPIGLAWQEISLGNGVISNVTAGNAGPFQTTNSAKTDNITINNIYIAYFDSPAPQRFMQPIYVFKGNYTSDTSNDNGSITIYYPAISGDYIRGSN